MGFEKEVFSSLCGLLAWGISARHCSLWPQWEAACPSLGRLSVGQDSLTCLRGKGWHIASLLEWLWMAALGALGSVPSPGHMLLTHQSKNVVFLEASF